MKKRLIKSVLSLFVLTAFLAGQISSVFALPQVTYLGGHSDTYTNDTTQHFVVKRTAPFRFDTVDSKTYTTQSSVERVWLSDSDWTAVYHAWKDFGQVRANCTVKFVAIDDDVDNRINRFYLNDKVIYESKQGMVVKGEFTTSEAGNLKLYAEDSIAAHIEVCPEPEPVDVCPNIDGMQESVPDGYQTVNGKCEKIPEEPKDVCPNIDGMQTKVPDGYKLVNDKCEKIPEEPKDEPEKETEVVNTRLSITKKVRFEGDDEWKDKITGVEVGDIIEFKIRVKNDSSDNGESLDDLKMKDELPDELEKLSGDLTEDWNDFDPDEEKTFTIKVKVKDSEFEGDVDKCIVNIAKVSLDGDQMDSDEATVCYDNVDIEELPQTGAASTAILAFMGLSSIGTGAVMKRKLR